MVRAILEDRKTQTRRVVRVDEDDRNVLLSRCSYGQPGDRLWVRETWAGGIDKTPNSVDYRADGHSYVVEPKWRPSIHMPRWASRLTLEVTKVRVQRLQGISVEEARAEGIERSNDERWPWRNYDPLDGASFVNATTSFMSLWNSINGARADCSWEENPWVWAITFRRLP